MAVEYATAKVKKLKQRVFGDPERKPWQDVAGQAVAATRRRIDTAEAEYLRIDLFAPAAGRELARLLTLNEQPSAERIVRSAGLQKEEERDRFAKVVGIFLEELHQALSANPALREHATARIARTIDTRTSAMHDDIKEIKASVGIQRPASRLSTLPSRVKDFVGRQSDIDRLVTALTTSGRAAISAVSGMGGIGKTSLALEVAHAVAEHFADGALFIDLQGQSASPLSSLAAMTNVMRQIKPEIGQLPETIEALVPLYRRILSGNKFLLLLDNAKDADQVEPLLPPEPVALLVTARKRVSIPGGTRLDLNLLTNAEAVELLHRAIGTARPLSEPELDEIIRICDGLPIALNAAGRFLVDHETWTVAEYLKELSSDRWLALPRVERVLRLSIEVFERDRPEFIDQWRKLSVFPSTFDRAAATEVWAIEENESRSTLDDLLVRALILFDATSSRFRLHDLYRDLAAIGLSPSQHDDAIARHSKHYVQLLHRASRFYAKGGPGVLKGLAIFDLEWANIEQGQAWAAAHAERNEIASFLAIDYIEQNIDILRLRINPVILHAWCQAELMAARKLRDKVNEISAIGNRANVAVELGRPDLAKSDYEMTLSLARAIGHRRSEGAAFVGLGRIAMMSGQLNEAVRFFQLDLRIAREIGDQRGEATTLGLLGMTFGLAGKFREAGQVFHLQLVIAQAIGDRFQIGRVTGDIGLAMQRCGDIEGALVRFESCLAIAHEIGDRDGEAIVLGKLGVLRRETGDPTASIHFLTKSLAIARERGDLSSESAALYNLALAWCDAQDQPRAIELAKASLRLKRALGDYFAPQVEAKIREWVSIQIERERRPAIKS